MEEIANTVKLPEVIYYTHATIAIAAVFLRIIKEYSYSTVIFVSGRQEMG